MLRRMLGPLILIFLLCDADSACDPELNPLTLDPPEVIGKYGDPMIVNCTSSEEDHDEMYWIIGDVVPEREEERNFISSVVILSDWNLKAECKVKLNDTFECSKDLKITIYKTPDNVSISALDDGPMVEGTEYLLNCDIVNVAPVQNLEVKWYRGNETVHTQKFRNTSVTPVNVSSTLRVTAERDLDGARFRCEAELHLGPKGPESILTATSLSYTAAVHYKPLIRECPDHYVGLERNFSLDMLPFQAEGNPPPTVQWYYQGKPIKASEPLTRTHSGNFLAEVRNIVGMSNTSVNIAIEYAPEFKNTTDFVIVYEGDDVSLSCDADANPPPVFYWTQDGVYIGENTNNLNITRVLTSAIYECRAANDLGNITKQIIVNRLANPAAMTTPEASAQTDCHLILTPAEVVVRFGDPVSVNCSTSATDVLGMGWEAPLGGTGFKQLSTITWKVNSLTVWSMEPMCYVTLGNDQCTEKPNITIYKTPDNVSISALDDGPMVEGTEYLLNCDIVNVAPVQNLEVKWYRGNETVHTQKFRNTSVTPVNVSSTLRVTAERDLDGARFRCEAELHLGPKGPESIPTATSLSYTAAVHYKPLIRECPDHYVGLERNFSLDMLPFQAEGNPPPTVQWYYQGKPIKASEPLTRTHSGNFLAEVRNIVGMSNTSVNIAIEYSPSLICNNHHYDVKEDDQLQTVCEPKGIPPPDITWSKDGVEMIHITDSYRWTKHDSGNYSLSATNKHGRDSHWLYLDVLYAPVFMMENYTKEVNAGENVTFECSAEGNPPPEVRWKYTRAVNVMETAGGRQKNISVTGATSTNAGVYVCVATNRAGHVTRSVTLELKGKTFAVPPEVLWGLLFLFIILFIICLILLCHSCRKKHGQYSFIPDKANDGSDRSIPMTTKSDGVKASDITC